jgi:hypothetical protein
MLHAATAETKNEIGAPIRHAAPFQRERHPPLPRHRASGSGAIGAPWHSGAAAVRPSQGGLLQRKCACGGTPGPTGECAACRAKRLGVQRKGGANTQASHEVAPPIVHDVLRSPSQPLDSPTRMLMESRFGQDFRNVRVHTGAEAGASARAIDSLAYTVGQTIVFGSGQYAPRTQPGLRLIAHELTHVVQQRGSGSPSGPLSIGPANDAHEMEADRAAERVLGGTRMAGRVRSIAPRIQRACGPAAIGSPSGCALLEGDVQGEPFLFRVGCDDFLTPPDSSSDEEARLRALAATLSSGDTITIHGFASSEGAQDFNEHLSCARAIKAQSVLSGTPIPLSIRIVAHGATAGSRRDRRSVVIDKQSAPPSPESQSPESTSTPANQPDAGPADGDAPEASTPDAGPTDAGPSRMAANGVCGPDVTAQIASALAGVRSAFAGWTPTQKNEACDAADKVLAGAADSWDILPLFRNCNGWILGYRPACATAGATPPCGSSVQVGSECYYSGTANYVLFGVMCKLCSDHLMATNPAEASRFTESEMLHLIDRYKGPGSIIGAGANFAMCQQWSRAGYQGWPSGGTPPSPGDKANCATTCPTPFTPPPVFVARWLPHLPPPSSSCASGGGR